MTDEQEREKFEEWAKTLWFGPMTRLAPEHAWAAWQARAALSEPALTVMEPVAWCSLTPSGRIGYFDGKPMVMVGPIGNEHHTTPLYTSPAAPRAPLREEQIGSWFAEYLGVVEEEANYNSFEAGFRAAERAHGIWGEKT